MGVDSGLPDFRGERGFWRAYPLYERLGLNFQAMANPRWFQRDPAFAWGFYGHRQNLYRQTVPHEGFQILLSMAHKATHGAFVFTSNVDGQFQKAGFAQDRIAEVHGSIHHLQCLRECGIGIIEADPYTVDVDLSSMKARDPLPLCPRCGGLLRPNILMFGDATWDETRTYVQESAMEQWLKDVEGKRLCIIECGAGTAIPSVRHFCEGQMGNQRGKQATLIRINPAEPAVPKGGISLANPALLALRALSEALR